ALETYIMVEDEIMQVISFDENSIEVVRDQLESYADSHDSDTELSSIYLLEGNPIELALKVMLSEEGNEYYVSSETIEAFRYVDDVTDIPGAVIFQSYNIQEETGLTFGDKFKIEGSDLNDDEYIINGFGTLDDGRSYIIADKPLNIETSSEPVFSFLSKYAVLPTGLGMLPNEVDVEGFEDVYSLYSPNFVDYVFKIKDTIDSAKDFIDSEIFFPQGLYSVPRRARSSVRFTSPPLSVDDTPLLDSNN